jgi:hypothetical protein
VGSNPIQGMDVWCVCVRFSVFVLLSCVYAEALRRADNPSKESYRLWMIKKLRNQPYAPKWEQEEVKSKADSDDKMDRFLSDLTTLFHLLNVQSEFLNENPVIGMLITSYIRREGSYWRKNPNIGFSF